MIQELFPRVSCVGTLDISDNGKNPQGMHLQGLLYVYWVAVNRIDYAIIVLTPSAFKLNGFLLN